MSKGIIVKINDIIGDVKYLNRYREYKIDDLPLEVKKKFENTRSFLQSIRYSDLYEEIYRKIINIFQREGMDKEGTVGSYFLSCWNKGCSDECKNSLSIPVSMGEICMSETLYLRWENGSYSLPSFDERGEIVFEIDHKFRGFNEREKEYLRKKGVKVCRFIYENEIDEYSLDLIPTRNNYSYILIIGIILIIFIIIILSKS